MAALYAAYALRDMARRYTATASVAAAVAAAAKAASNAANSLQGFPGAGLVATVAVLQSVTGPPPKLPPLFTMLRGNIDPAIDAGSGPVLAAAVQRAHRVPQYEQVFAPPGNGLPEFRGPFINAMKDMIVPSDKNAAAGRCVRGVGYGYLNGAMAAAGLFDTTASAGVWLAGDFVGTYPYARINSANDGLVAQAGSALALAKLMALIVNRGVLDTGSCDAMRALLAAVGIDQPWLTRSPDVGDALRIPLAKVTHAKLGYGPLKGGNVCSEMFRLEGLGKPAKSYAVAFQNLNPQVMGLGDVAFMLRRAIQIYEK